MGAPPEGDRAWAAARSLGELGELVAQWLEGRLSSVPTQVGEGGPDPETGRLVAVLAAFNRAGYVTENSQPGEPLGEDGWAQRACVRGYCGKETAQTVAFACLATELVCIVSWPGACEGPYVPVTIDNGRANTWDGMPFEPEHISYVWGRACSPAAVEALIGAWQVAVIDPVWGRNDLVNGRGGSRGSDGTHCLAAVRALGAASGPGTTLRNAVARGETAPMGADPPLERWADDEALRALARLARNLPVVGADEAMAPPGAADWSAARRHPAGARSPGSPQCLSFRARRCAGCGSKRGRKVHFSLQHARFIDAVCSRGLGLQEAGAEVEEDPEVAENLWRMMLEIAENERRFPPPAG